MTICKEHYGPYAALRADEGKKHRSDGQRRFRTLPRDRTRRFFFRIGSCYPDKGSTVSQHDSRFDIGDDALQYGMKIMTRSAMETMHNA